MEKSFVKPAETFGRIVAESIPGILSHQQSDGSIVYDAAAPIIYPQQAIFPLAFCWAGLDPDKKFHRSPQVHDAILKLGDYLVSRFTDKGHFAFDSYGNKVDTVDQRLTYAWVEGLRIAREAGGDFPFERWADKILRACNTLIEHRLKRIQGVRRFIGRVLGTSTNHVALYTSTIFRAGKVLNRPDLCDYVLPIAAALAADIHPNGYWEEHGDLLRSGGPTPSYNYLTHCGMSLMYEWTQQDVFRDAILSSTRFHSTFTYPDATFFDLIDERVRYGKEPRPWGLFGFSHTPEGRGCAIAHLKGWLAARRSPDDVSPEMLARFCENAMYWHDGDVAPPPFEQREHFATMSLPAGMVHKRPWCIGLSAMRATNAEDPAYRDNPFGLDRQKLFSVWHEQAGLIIDGSHSKNQPENSTFATEASYAPDFWPCGGAVGEEDGDFIVRAAYKTFFGMVRLRILSGSQLQIEFSIDPAGNRGPFTAGFTLRPLGRRLSDFGGKEFALTENFERAFEQLRGGFRLGNIRVSGPPDMRLNWPMSPFNSYTSNNKSDPKASLLRVSVQLLPTEPSKRVVVEVNSAS